MEQKTLQPCSVRVFSIPAGARPALPHPAGSGTPAREQGRVSPPRLLLQPSLILGPFVPLFPWEKGVWRQFALENYNYVIDWVKRNCFIKAWIPVCFFSLQISHYMLRDHPHALLLLHLPSNLSCQFTFHFQIPFCIKHRPTHSDPFCFEINHKPCQKRLGVFFRICKQH